MVDIIKCSKCFKVFNKPSWFYPTPCCTSNMPWYPYDSNVFFHSSKIDKIHWNAHRVSCSVRWRGMSGMVEWRLKFGYGISHGSETGTIFSSSQMTQLEHWKRWGVAWWEKNYGFGPFLAFASHNVRYTRTHRVRAYILCPLCSKWIMHCKLAYRESVLYYNEEKIFSFLYDHWQTIDK